MSFSGMQLEGQFDSAIGLALDHEQSQCYYCHKSEREFNLFEHELSGCNLCQDCLGKYLEADLDTEGRAEFGGWLFEVRLSPYKRIEASNDDRVRQGGTVAEALEMVLMVKKLI